MHEWLLRRWYSDAPAPLALRPFAALFGSVAAARRRALQRRATHLRVPVIVVGNILVGGTGKTPFVLWLVEQLRLWGWKPGIVSRGYGGDAGGKTWLVTPQSDPRQVGDEPVLLARRAGCPVAVGVNRLAAAESLLAQTGVDILVSDDGLQHYRMHRDLEIVVVDAARGLGNGALLPAGPLREPAWRLAQVDLVVVNGGAWRSRGGCHVDMHLLAEDAERLDGLGSMPLSRFEGQTVHAVAGIGNPERFFAKLEALRIGVVPHPFPDHHPFAAGDLEFGDDRPVLMTEKDAVKCRAFGGPNRWFVPVDAALSAADTAAVQKFVEALRRTR